MSDEERCEGCEEGLSLGHSHCAVCGRAIPAPKPAESNLVTALKIVGISMALIFLIVLFFEIYTVFWGFGTIITDIGNHDIARIFILAPAPYLVVTLTGAAAQMYYLFLVITVIASFLLLLYASRDGLNDLKRKDVSRMDSVPLYSVITLFAADISFNVIFIMMVMAAGSEPAVPPVPAYPVWREWYTLLNASVWEEVLCRVGMIGIPLAVLGLMMREKGSWKRLLGGFGMNGAAVVFIIFSALMFAYAHLSGWDVFKIIPTIVGGLALGYLFVKYGLYASIMLHFLIDYMQSFVWVLGDSTGTAVTVLVMLLLVMIGIIFFAWYAVRGIKHVKKMISER